jgi:hypothetical protein
MERNNITRVEILNLATDINKYISDNFNALRSKKSIKKDLLVLSEIKLSQYFGISVGDGKRVSNIYEENIIKAILVIILAKFPEIRYIVDERDPEKSWIFLDTKLSLGTKAERLNKWLHQTIKVKYEI